MRALQLLERYGVLTREMALAEGAEGGFAGVYPVLKALEETENALAGFRAANRAEDELRLGLEAATEASRLARRR